MLCGYWTTGIVGICSLKITTTTKKIPEISCWLAVTFCTVLQREWKAKPSSIPELMRKMLEFLEYKSTKICDKEHQRGENYVEKSLQKSVSHSPWIFCCVLRCKYIWWNYIMLGNDVTGQLWAMWFPDITEPRN